jgi:assimilatory nitrate reductase catalytic subunit
VPAPGQTRHDWQIVVDLSNKLQERGIAPNNWNLINWGQTPIDSTPELIWNEHRASTRGRDLDITGLSYALLEQSPQQWPYPENGAPQARLYEDGVFPTPSGKAQFANTVYKPVAEPRESRFPFSLTTGRLRDHWHGMSRTGTLARLFGHVAEPVIQVNPQDLARKGWRDGDLVHVTSKRGSIVVPVQASAEVGMSQAFMAMHWGAEYLSGQSRTGEPLAGVNALTTSAYCPSSKQPELKHAAVKILKAELPWTLLAMAWLPADAVLHAQRALRLLMPSFAFATCVPFGRERQGVLFRAAHHEAPAPELLAQLEALLGLNTPDVLRYADRKAGQQRCMKVARQGDVVKLEGFLLGGDTQSQAWITTLLQEELPAQSYGRLLLLPGAKAPVAVQSQGKAVCTCLNVSQSAIEAHLNALHEQPGLPPSPVACLQSLKDNLQCGTNCGSCVPELQKIIRAVHVPV